MLQTPRINSTDADGQDVRDTYGPYRARAIGTLFTLQLEARGPVGTGISCSYLRRFSCPVANHAHVTF